MENNPISESDPDGDCPWCLAFIKGAAQVYVTQVTTNLANGKDWKTSLTNVDGTEILKSGAIDAVTLGVGSLIGKAKTAIRIVNSSDKAIQAEQTAVKLNKIANTSEKLSKVEKNIVKAVNANSKSSQKAQVVYGIKNTDDEIVKVGISSGKVNKKGIPYRAINQVNSRKYGKDKYFPIVLDKQPAGVNARKKD